MTGSVTFNIATPAFILSQAHGRLIVWHSAGLYNTTSPCCVLTYCSHGKTHTSQTTSKSYKTTQNYTTTQTTSVFIVLLSIYFNCHLLYISNPKASLSIAATTVQNSPNKTNECTTALKKNKQKNQQKSQIL